MVRLLVGLLAVLACAGGGADPVVALAAEGDGIPTALTSAPGDPRRGRAIFLSRSSNCLLCHSVPDSGDRRAGSIGPSLAGVGSRLTEAQMRLRVVDPSRLNSDSVMPSYFRVEGLRRVAGEYRGRPVLDAQQIEDVIAYLCTLR